MSPTDFHKQAPELKKNGYVVYGKTINYLLEPGTAFKKRSWTVNSPLNSQNRIWDWQMCHGYISQRNLSDTCSISRDRDTEIKELKSEYSDKYWEEGIKDSLMKEK